MNEPDAAPPWVDALRDDIRRHGRAAVGARAAAESCEERVAALEAKLGDGARTGEDGGSTERLVRALLPTRDALAHMARQAPSEERAPAHRPRVKRWLERLVAAPRPEPLVDGLGLLLRQLDAALEAAGVELVGEVGVPVDPIRHRVVETRPSASEEIVLEVVRTGALLGGRVLREADVVASSEAAAPPDTAPR